MASDGRELLVVSGEIDIATAPRLIGVLNNAVTDGGRSLVIDLTDVAFMDSTGLALLIDAQRRLSSRGRGFAVVCPPGPLMRVFETTDMVGRLGVYADREDAVRAVG
jgi:anti-sigma B factor antagonist